MSKVIVDPGHSGPIEPGACNAQVTIKECDVVLAISQQVKLYLEAQGHQVILTREGDIDNDNLSWRGQIANDENADLFLSIHANACDNPEAHGFEVWTTPGETISDGIAEDLFNCIAVRFPELTPRSDLSDGDHDKEARFTVIVVPDCASVLIETAFISNPAEASWLNDVVFQRRYGKAIAEGANRYLTRGAN